MEKTRNTKKEDWNFLESLMNKLPVEDEFCEMDRETLVKALAKRLKETDHDLEVGSCPSCGADNWSNNYSRDNNWTDEYSCGVCGLLADVAVDVWSEVDKKYEDDKEE